MNWSNIGIVWFLFFKKFSLVLTLIRIGLFGAPHGWWVPPSINSVVHILQWWDLAQLYLTFKGPKTIWLTWHIPWVLLESAVLLQKSAFFYIKKYMYRLHFDTTFLVLCTFLESLKTVVKKSLDFDNAIKNDCPRRS